MLIIFLTKTIRKKFLSFVLKNNNIFDQRKKFALKSKQITEESRKQFCNLINLTRLTTKKPKCLKTMQKPIYRLSNKHGN